jgi:MFS family permease
VSTTRVWTLGETVKAGPRWARIYLPSSGLDGLVEALWLFTLGWEASRAGSASGLVLAAGAVPSIAFVLWGGSLADRLGAHRVAVWTMLARVLILGAWAAILVTDAAPAYLAAAVAFATGSVAGIHDPAVSALPRLLVPAAGLEATTNAQRICIRLVQTIGPSVGGLIAGWFGVATVGVVAAAVGLLPLAGYAALRRTRAPQSDQPSPADWDHGDGAGGSSSLWAGFQWVRKDPVVRRTLPVQGVVNLTTTSILMAALPRQARMYGWGAETYGLAAGAFGAGMLLGSLAAFAIRSRAPRRKLAIAVACAALASVMVAVTGSAVSAGMAIAAAGLMGLAIGPVGSVLTGWTMAASARSDPATYGRVYAVLLLVTVAGEPLGFVIFSALASITSTATTAIVFGSVGLIVAVFALAARAVRVGQTG